MIQEEDINGVVLYEDAQHKFIWLGGDPEVSSGVVQTNQYLIIDNGRGLLMDPGGIHLFARAVAVASRYISLDRIDAIFFSHQDPDVSSGIALWLGVTPAKIYISSLWLRFLPHFGLVDQKRIVGIEDTSNTLRLSSGAQVRFVPAHFLHSTGQFNLFDERSGILFTGDIGAAVFPQGQETVFVEAFDKLLPYIEPFHKRYMAGNRAAKRWTELVRALNPKMLAPQHGAVYREAELERFLDWFSKLQCGLDLLDSIYSSGRSV